jgi:hypothetical protein
MIPIAKSINLVNSTISYMEQMNINFTPFDINSHSELGIGAE